MPIINRIKSLKNRGFRYIIKKVATELSTKDLNFGFLNKVIKLLTGNKYNIKLWTTFQCCYGYPQYF
jgi:hypothetical protein